MWSLASLFPLIFGASALAASVPQPSEIKIFKDWAVGCDNGGDCQAVSLEPENDSGGIGNGEGLLTMIRTAGNDDIFKIHVLIQSGDFDRYKMMVDGRLVDTGPIAKGDNPIEIVGEDARKVSKALARGMRMEITGPNGESLTSISLSGSTAAMRYMDARQKRAGTNTALVAKGRRMFRPLEASIPVITVDQWEASKLIPETGEIVSLVENSACKNERYGVVEDQVFPMGKRGNKNRALVLISCGSGAYNFSSAVYIGEYISPAKGGGKTATGWQFKLAKFDKPPSWGGDGGPPLLVNADWDETNQLLGSYAKGRGLGDCGTAERFVWDGEQFRLVEASQMNECRGGYEWITTWRANYQKRENLVEQAAATDQ
ncbi:DUF1176 domain-containing protein [Parasphingorhabdus halotolerans]|uniref:DUF1176 domain-containing protein n=1 Tax=Parasphingorhabdus halotolerans TaxID=2725558 RepID=A0A6H2DPY9_9SPHN|nr:DUF1176 domain-containing protein [Parasphingorhabdus halotolerans]QJB70404.1 DUF1176 domain-containing protein [Parasphingorhabdus halotolerans]